MLHSCVNLILYFCAASKSAINSENTLIKYILTYLFLLFPLLIFCQENNNLTIGDFNQIPDSIDFVYPQTDTLYSDFQETDTLRIDSSRAPAIDAPIVYNAEDSVIISFDGQKVFLYNNSKVTYQKIELTAYYIEIDMETREVYAEGLTDSTGTLTQLPVFKDGNEEFESNTLRYNFKSEKGIITNVVTRQGEGFIHSERTKKISTDAFMLVDGKYTVCDADHPHFYLHLSKAKVISNDKIVTGPSYMVLEDFPIYFLSLPFGYFPVTSTHSSGVIIPRYGEEVNRGFFLQDGGYYWAASEYIDLAVMGSIYTKGSWDTKINTEYKKRYKYGGRFNFSYAKNIYGEKWLETYSASKQFAITWSHSQDAKANPGQTFSANVNFSTSGYDKQNSSTVGDYLTTTKASNISFTKMFDNTPFNASVNLRHSQNSKDTTISLSIPEITLNMSRIYPLKRKNQVGAVKWYQNLAVSYTGNIRNEIFAKEYEVLEKSLLNDWKNGIKHSIPISFPGFNLFNYFNFSPGISYNEKWYFKKYNYEYSPGEAAGNGHPANVSMQTIKGFNRVYDYSFSLGTSTNIYGNFTPLNPNSRISSIRHKMTPSISFNYKPDFGASRYGFWQAVQTDSIGTIQYFDINRDGIHGGSPGRGASGSVSFSLGNSVEMKVLDSPRVSKSQAQNDDEEDETDNNASEAKYKKVKIIEDLGFNASYNLIADSMNLSMISIRARTTIKGISVNATGTLNPYVVDKDGKPINKYAFIENRGLAKLGRLTNANLSFSLPFRSKQGRSQSDSNRALIEEDGMLPGNYADYADFNVPWDLNVNYSLNYTGPAKPSDKGKIMQTLGLSGNLNLTDKWRMSMNTNFDITARQFSLTTFNVTRDLHCWQMVFNFVPFGFRKSYNFTISARSSILRDLKLAKRSTYHDNARF